MTTFDMTLHELQREHAALEQEVREWREWWRELRELGLPKLEEMGHRLTQFRAHLAEHFDHEEHAGPLAELAGSGIDSAEHVQKLWREHRELLESLDELILRLERGAVETGLPWTDARSEFETFLDQLQAHEADERRMIAHLTQDHS